MLPNRIVLIVVRLVYHTRTTSPLLRPYYDRYPLTITDRVRYYCLAYVIQKYALSVKLISFCVYHTNVLGYHNHLCNPVTHRKSAQSLLCNVSRVNCIIRTISMQTLQNQDQQQNQEQLEKETVYHCQSNCNMRWETAWLIMGISLLASCQNDLTVCPFVS